VTPARAGAGEHDLEVLQHALSLLGRAAGNQSSAFRVDRELAGDEEQVAGTHGMAIGGGGGRLRRIGKIQEHGLILSAAW